MLEEIRELYEFNRWANLRILEAAGRLDAESLSKDMGSSFPSVLETLAHIVAADWIWLQRWKGTSPPAMPDTWELTTLSALRAKWDEIEEERSAFLASLREDALREPLAYRTTKGEPFANPLWQLLRHVVNHSTYHRGQVTTMLRQLGASAVATDLVLFYREPSRSPAVAGTGR